MGKKKSASRRRRHVAKKKLRAPVVDQVTLETPSSSNNDHHHVEEAEQRTAVVGLILSTTIDQRCNYMLFLDIRGCGRVTLSRPEKVTWRYGAAFVCAGSRFYMIGGDVIPPRWYQEGDARDYSKDVWYCNITWGDADGDISFSKWEEGPPLKGIKPHPMLVTVQGKIYALAGLPYDLMCCPIAYCPRDALRRLIDLMDPMFEVLDDPLGGQWRTLPHPPFALSLNRKCMTETLCNTVYGKIICFHVIADYHNIFYCFDTETEIWTAVDPNKFLFASTPQHDVNALIVENLASIWWDGRADIASKRIFMCNLGMTCNRPKISAFDLLSTRYETDLGAGPDDDISVFYGHNDFFLKESPIHGLSSVLDDLDNPNWGYIAHLTGDMFYLFTGYPKCTRTCLRVATFQLTEQDIQASSSVRERPVSLWASNIQFCDFEDFEEYLYVDSFNWYNFLIPK